MTVVACRQVAPRIGDLPANRALATGAIREAAAAGADLVVLPELVTSGYAFSGPDEAASVAIAPDDEVLADWAVEARRGGCVVIGGFCERGPGGRLHNSAAVVDGSGVLAVYRKTHLWDRERLIFTPGRAVPPVVDTALGRIGVLVCYDLEFPEMPRTLALRGADLVAVPTNWPLVERPDGERPPEVVAAMASARANRIFIACCDRAGPERGQEWTRGSAVIDELGWVVATADDAGRLMADVDLTRARDKRLTARSDALADRRPELYSAVLQEPKAR